LLLYYITDRRQFPGSPADQRRALLAKIAEAAAAGVDYIQLREKDLTIRDLETLAREALTAISATVSSAATTNDQRPKTRLLVNSRTDIALAVGAAGVHLPSGDLPASEVRALAATVHRPLSTVHFLIGVSCHSAAEVRSAASHAADFAVFGPVFEKEGAQGAGLAALRQACAQTPAVAKTEGAFPSSMPVLALGGVTLENARDCLRAGAAGIAGIRLFQQNDVATVVRALRG
jgi:thiamine-phosphate pyrophosphorylase